MKKIILIMLSMILIISLVGCKKNDLEDFKTAVAKTEEITRGQSRVESNVNIEFDTKGLTEEEIKTLNYFKEIELNIDKVFNQDKEKIISRNYFSFGGLGFDTVFYKNGDRSFIKMPIIGKYMDLHELNNKGEEGLEEEVPYPEEDFISKEAQKQIMDNWLSVLKQDDVFSGNDSVMSTPDGEVKVTHYTIELTGDQIKDIVLKTMDILAKDPSFVENITKIIEESTSKGEETDIIKLFMEMKRTVKESDIGNIKYNAFIDIDGYIVKEDFKINVSFEPNESAKMKELEYTMETNRWEINKEQEFEFPVLNEDNTFDPKDIEQGMPFMLEDVIGNKE